jgi:hypothetical protein
MQSPVILLVFGNKCLGYCILSMLHLDFRNTQRHLFSNKRSDILKYIMGLSSSTVQQWLQEWPNKVISFYGTRNNRFIVASIIISNFLQCTILVTKNAKSFFQQNFNLIPKGQTVPMGDKPVFGSVAWSHTIFRFLEFFSQLHLGISFAWVQISWF